MDEGDHILALQQNAVLEKENVMARSIASFKWSKSKGALLAERPLRHAPQERNADFGIHGKDSHGQDTSQGRSHIAAEHLSPGQSKKLSHEPQTVFNTPVSAHKGSRAALRSVSEKDGPKAFVGFGDIEPMSRSNMSSPACSDIFHDTCEIAGYLEDLPARTPTSSEGFPVAYEPTMVMNGGVLVPTPTGLLNSYQPEDMASPQLSAPATPADYTDYSGYIANVLLCNNNNLYSPVPEAEASREDTLDLSLHLAGHNLATTVAGEADTSGSLQGRFNLEDIQRLRIDPNRRLSYANSVETARSEPHRRHSQGSAKSLPARSHQELQSRNRSKTSRRSWHPEAGLISSRKSELEGGQYTPMQEQDSARILDQAMDSSTHSSQNLTGRRASLDSLCDVSATSRRRQQTAMEDGNTMQLAWQPSFAEEYKKLLEEQTCSLQGTTQQQASAGLTARSMYSWLEEQICSDSQLSTHQMENVKQRLYLVAKELDAERQAMKTKRDEVASLLVHHRCRSTNAELRMSSMAMRLKQKEEERLEEERKYSFLHGQKYIPLKNAYVNLKTQQEKVSEAYQNLSIEHNRSLDQLRDAEERRSELEKRLHTTELRLSKAKEELEEERSQSKAKLAAVWDQLDDQQAEVRGYEERVKDLQLRLKDAQAGATSAAQQFTAETELKLQELRGELANERQAAESRETELAKVQSALKSEHTEKLKLLQICDQLLTEAEHAKMGSKADTSAFKRAH